MKFLAWQVPIFIFLAFSLFHINANILIFGVSTEAAKSLREILLVVSSILGLATSALNAQISYIDEMLRAVAIKYAGENSELETFLKLRYGLFEISPFASFNSEFSIGTAQWIIGAVNILSGITIIAAVVTVGLYVQLFSLIEIYIHPNFSTLASVFVISFVLLVDIETVTSWFLRKGFQPYQTYEDLMKLERIRQKDEKLYQAHLSEMVQRHNRKGLLRRIFGRPTLKKFP